MRNRVSIAMVLGIGIAIAGVLFSSRGWLAAKAEGPEPAAQPAAKPVHSQQQAAGPTENPFPGRFPAPSLDGGTEWLNTSGPISLQDLRGKIVLLDFWTYCCINCMHVLPDLKYLEEKYPNELVVIGVHAAKFDNEKESENIRSAILRYEITHPVINDSEMVVARKYQFSSWPTLVLIDPEGNFVGQQPGEGSRELFDSVIGKLVAYHRAKGTLDETPVKFNLEREKVEPTPLRYPGKILADAAGQRLFITDSNHNRIVVAGFDGKLLDTIGSGAIGSKDGSYQAASFDHPQGTALVDDVLYVADTENHLLRAVDLKTKQVKTLAGTGVQSRVRPTFGGGGHMRKTALNSPWAITELKGTLYIAMAGPHQIWKHHIGSDTIVPFIGSGREDILDGPLREAALAQPSDIVTDGTVLYHVDSEGSAIRRDEIGSHGTVKTVVGPHDFPSGRSLFEFADIDGTGDAVRMQHPIGLVFHEGMLYVADTYNDKIKKVDPERRTAVTWLGTGKRGKALEPVELAEPAGLTIAGKTMYIADTNNHRILQTDLSTKETKEFVIAGLQPPAPPRSSEEQPYTGEQEKITTHTVPASGPATVQVNFSLPITYQLNQLAPLTYRLTVHDKQSILDPAQLGKSHRAQAQESSATFTLPLTGETGTAEVTLTVNYQYCKHGTGGVCRFASKRWTFPLTVAAQGDQQIVLSAKP
jgi:thiol-disulfide isomerase/thioredoxin